MNEFLHKALALLPHGPEFRFIDELLELDPGVSGKARYTVRGDEPFLRGHFPNDPLFPGVLILEAAAQLGGIVAQSDPTIPPLQGLKLTALRSIKIRGSAKPGEAIILAAKMMGRMPNLVQAEVRAEVDQTTILEGVLVLSGEPVRICAA